MGGIKNRLLFVHLRHVNYFWESLFTDPEMYKRKLLTDYPEMTNWIKDETFNLKPIWPDAPVVDYQWESKNQDKTVSGGFIASNLETPTDIIHGFIHAEEVINALKKALNEGFPYTHVGFSIYVAAYSKFVECANAVKNFDENIITIAGNAGALFPGTEKYVDYVCKGDGIPFLRKLLGENETTPYKLEIVPQNTYFLFQGIRMPMKVLRLVTKLGCPHSCDFCITHHLYEGKVTNPFFTPQHVHDKIVEYVKKVNYKDFIIMFCEPQAIINKKWWYDLFESFNGDTQEYPIIILSTLASIADMDLDRISKSALRINFINIGIESFSHPYSKNVNHHTTKEIIGKLADYGIGTYATFIIGYDHQDRNLIWEEIHKLVDLDIAQIELFNLHPLPETPLWDKYKSEGRLLDVPNDFYYLPGFQSFYHPHFRPGFEDILPLMYEIYQYFEKERGPSILELANLYQNIPNPGQIAKRSTKYYKIGAHSLFESWKKYLDPSPFQIENYIRKLGSLPKDPFYMKVLRKSSFLQRIVSTLIR